MESKLFKVCKKIFNKMNCWASTPPEWAMAKRALAAAESLTLENELLRAMLAPKNGHHKYERLVEVEMPELSTPPERNFLRAMAKRALASAESIRLNNELLWTMIVHKYGLQYARAVAAEMPKSKEKEIFKKRNMNLEDSTIVDLEQLFKRNSDRDVYAWASCNVNLASFNNYK